MKPMEERYHNAEKLLYYNLERHIKNRTIEPYGLDDRRFWYKRDALVTCTDCDESGCEFMIVDIEDMTLSRIFDHERVAASLSHLLQHEISDRNLPIQAIDLVKENVLSLAINKEFTQSNNIILLNLESYVCTFWLSPNMESADESHSVVSPTGQYEVRTRQYNLILHDLTSGEETDLTLDGERYYGYGNYSDYVYEGLFEGASLPPNVLWSPNGRYLAIQRIDEREVEDLPILQSVSARGSTRPVSKNYKMAFPGDSRVSLASLCVVDIFSGDIKYSNRPPVPASFNGFMDSGAVFWGLAPFVYYIEWTRDRQTHRLIRFNYVDGISAVVIEETDTGFSGPWPIPMDGLPLVKVLADLNEVIWYSRRTGWGHLYRFDLTTGKLKAAITSGKYVVTNIIQIDLINNRIYFSACGREADRDPYYEHFYRVNLDGSALVLLTPEPSQHDIIYPISKGSTVNAKLLGETVFIDTVSRVDQPPKTILRSIDDGAELMLLSQLDEECLSNTPYTPPLPFSVKAADGVTDIYGVIYRPSDFDVTQIYPVILSLYGTPQVCITPKRFAQTSVWSPGDIYFVPPIAELGFCVVVLDPRGTPLRSKAFHDVAHANLQNGGCIDDQVTAIKQLGERYSWIDLDRVGITGFSGGGYASARAMLTHPEFFKVAVSNAGNHDQRLYCAGWVEPFQGLLDGSNYEAQASKSLAKNLRGKLLLTHGDADTNVHITHTFQLAYELIKHNRDFDLLVLPNRRHYYFHDPYFIRRMWDYFVEHLLGDTPPNNYAISSPFSESDSN